MKARTLLAVLILLLSLNRQAQAGGVEPVHNESKRVDITDIADCMPAVDRGDALTFRGIQGKEACRLYIEATFGERRVVHPSSPNTSRASSPTSSGNITTAEDCYKRFEAGESIHYAGRTGRDACDFYLQLSMNQAQLRLQQEQIQQQQRIHDEQLRLLQQQKDELADAAYRQQMLQLFQQQDLEQQHQQNQQQQQNQQRVQQNRGLNCTTQYRGNQAYTNCY